MPTRLISTLSMSRVWPHQAAASTRNSRSPSMGGRRSLARRIATYSTRMPRRFSSPAASDSTRPASAEPLVAARLEVRVLIGRIPPVVRLLKLTIEDEPRGDLTLGPPPTAEPDAGPQEPAPPDAGLDAAVAEDTCPASFDMCGLCVRPKNETRRAYHEKPSITIRFSVGQRRSYA